MSRKISGGLAGIVNAATLLSKPYRRRITRALVCERMVQTVEIDANGVPLRFQSTTARSLHDVLKFGDDEPETIQWIASLEPGVLWDVGANIGLYSLYAAALGHTVVAFEPSAASFAAFARNTEINGLSDKISAYCVALSDKTQQGTLWMANSDAGHSMHSIVDNGGKRVRQAIPTFTATDFQRLMNLDMPDYLKVDVDGIEGAVFDGTAGLDSIRSILIEAESDDEQKAITEKIRERGFVLNASGVYQGGRNLVFDKTPTPAATLQTN
tara:strand:+ start:64 stop:870 length:807 start_codon:yes stop_codon:yes gene_type:complete